MRHEGIPLPEPIIANDLIISIVVAISVAILVLLKQNRCLVFSSLRSLLNEDDYFFIKNATAGDFFQHYTLLLCSIIGTSLYAATIFTPQPTWEHIGFIALGITAFLFLKTLAMYCYFSLFFGKKAKSFTQQYISLTIVLGTCCFIGYILLQFAPSIPPIGIHISIAIIGVIYYLSILCILIRDFFNRLHLIFHFILYLCTLEILPILTIAKSMA